MDIPDKIGNSYNFAAWQKLKHKKDEKLGDYIKELDVRLGQCAHGASELSFNNLIKACEKVSNSATRVSNQPGISPAVEQFCEKIQYVTEGIRKTIIKVLTQFQGKTSQDTAADNAKVAQCIDDINTHEKNVNTARQKLSTIERSIENTLKTMIGYVDGLKKQVGTVGANGLLSQNPAQWYDRLIVGECLDPIRAEAAQAKLIYEGITPAQTNYRGNPQRVITDRGLTTPEAVERVKKMISTIWARVNKTALAYELSYKRISTLLVEADSCKTLAKKYLAEHLKNTADQGTATAQAARENDKMRKFLEKTTASLQALRATIQDKCFTKTDFNRDYYQQTLENINKLPKPVSYDQFNAVLTQIKNYQDILSGKLTDARKLIEEAKKIQKLVLPNVKLTGDTPSAIAEQFAAFTSVFNQLLQMETDLVKKEKTVMPTLAKAADYLKKAMQKAK